MNSLFTETGYISLNKYGELLCGDRIYSVEQEDKLILVLSDGLGSGVKANILSTLTSTIIGTMVSNGLSIEECVQTIASTLPVCNQRQIAYSTFTIITVDDNQEIKIIQFDNPSVILLRNGKSVDYPISASTICGKTIYESTFRGQIGDIYITMSDGAIYAGVGKTLNYGWQRENIIEFIESKAQADISAKMAATIIADECNRLYENKPGDDTTIAAIKIRERTPVNLMIGPPKSPQDVPKYLGLFFSKVGKTIVCGGTTSTIVSEYLRKQLTSEINYEDKGIPPIGYIPGIDLVTEGVITISRVLENAKSYLSGEDLTIDWTDKKDGASLISKMLFEDATDINFFVGTAINPAHQNPNLPIHYGIKIRLIEELAECLKKMGKQIKVSYF